MNRLVKDNSKTIKNACLFYSSKIAQVDHNTSTTIQQSSVSPQFHTQNAVPSERLGLEVFDVVDFPVDDGPEAAIFVVVLQVGLADQRHLLIVLRALPCEERACRSRHTLVTF